MTRRIAARLRRAGPEIVLFLVVVFAGVSVWQAFAVSNHLRRQARDTSRIYARIVAALADPQPGAETQALLALVTDIAGGGIQMVVTDTTGRPTAVANLPGDPEVNAPEVHRIIRELDDLNPPIAVAGGYVHFGALPVARRLVWLRWFQLGLLATALTIGIWAYRSAVSRDRDRLWVAMARESAHQLGTPLMSAGAWVDRLADGDADTGAVAEHLRADLERLHRVARRFERIGSPGRRDRVALGALAERVVHYFEPRLPRRANPVTLTVRAPASGPTIAGDAVLVEWALEALVRNAIDALSGRGGTVEITVEDLGDSAEFRISDDGPGIPPDIRSTLFEPGVTTKTGGWGIGLALAQRIITDVHGGRLRLDPATERTTFIAELPAVRTADA
ncbi:MAG: HAMP domain-containing sensor histidine kinase [Gemmatimonadales bacterium]|jgi:signal transduction histidine kinase